MLSKISFVLDGRIVDIDFDHESGITPDTTVLTYLRNIAGKSGTKEGCSEGDCGACTVVLASLDENLQLTYRAVDSCLLFLPMIHGQHLITVEDLAVPGGDLHPVQQALIKTHGSQCGYCTPGIVMSMFALYKNINNPSEREIQDALGGNLCRCTGYQPIIDAAQLACVHQGKDQFSEQEDSVKKMLLQIGNNSVAVNSSDYSYLQPSELGEALTIRSENPEAVIICGATDAALLVTKQFIRLTQIIDLSRVRELKKIHRSKGSVVFGAAVNLNEMRNSCREILPQIATMLDVFGSNQIRNLATVAGNVGTASPIGDLPPVLMAYRAVVLLSSTRGKREMSLEEFITGYRQTDCKPQELITGIKIPLDQNGCQVRSYKVSKRRDLDISTVSAGFRVTLGAGNVVDDIGLYYGGMAERTKRAAGTEKRLRGGNWTRKNVELAMSEMDMDFEPISDARAAAEGRRIAARNLLLKFWLDTSPQNGGQL